MDVDVFCVCGRVSLRCTRKGDKGMQRGGDREGQTGGGRAADKISHRRETDTYLIQVKPVQFEDHLLVVVEMVRSWNKSGGWFD